VWKGKHNSYVSAIVSFIASYEMDFVTLRRWILKMDGFWRLNMKISDILLFLHLGKREVYFKKIKVGFSK